MTLLRLFFIVLFLVLPVFCLEFNINFKDIDSHLKTKNIGYLLHKLNDVLALARLLSSSSLPLYHYYVVNCSHLSWPRIKEIVNVYSKLKCPERKLTFAVEALLCPSCLVRWPGLWESSPAKLTTLLSKLPHSNPFYALGDLVHIDGPLSVQQKINKKPKIIKVLLEAASEAMLTDGLSAEEALVDLFRVGIELVDLDPMRQPRLFTADVFDWLYEQLNLSHVEAEKHWNELDRLIWAFNYAEVCNRENHPIGVHPPSHAVHRLYLSLLPVARGRKTAWSSFMRELLRPGDGILAKAQDGQIIGSAQISIIKAAMRCSLSGPFQNFLIYRWLMESFPDLKDLKFLTSEIGNLSPYSALDLFNDDEAALSSVLQSSEVDVEQIPLFLSRPWVQKRRTHSFTSALTFYFSFEARQRLFLQYTKIHWEILLSFDLVHNICIDFRSGRDRQLAILEDLAEDLQQFELMNMREVTAELQIQTSNESDSDSVTQATDLQALFRNFWEALIERKLFREVDSGALLPNPWIRPKLWLLLGRFFTVAFHRGIRFPANLRLKKSFFQAAFNQKFEPREREARPDFIQFNELENGFVFNRRHQFRELLQNREEGWRRPIAYAQHVEASEETAFYRFMSLKGRGLFSLEPPKDFVENETTAGLSLKRLVRRATREGMFQFWLGLEPLVSFFTAEEVYDALFETTDVMESGSDGSNDSSSDNDSIGSETTASSSYFTGHESESEMQEDEDDYWFLEDPDIVLEPRR